MDQEIKFCTIFPPLTRTFRLIRHDPRGTGLSDRDVTDYSIEAMMRDLDVVVDRVGLREEQVVGELLELYELANK